MIERRDMLAALACAGVLGSAEWLRPRRKLVLMPAGAKLTDLIPSYFGTWSAGGSGDIVIPRTEGSLAARLYDDQLARAYHESAGNLPEVMILVAHGGAQSDILQLHRPEVCYPALGFEIIARNFVDIPAGTSAAVPAVALTARSGTRVEDIVYWTRLGKTLPRTASEQRSDRLRAALAGYVGDGVLFRASAVRINDEPQFGSLTRFLEALTASLGRTARVALLGPRFAV